LHPEARRDSCRDLTETQKSNVQKRDQPATINDEATRTIFFQNMWTMLIRTTNHMARIEENDALFDAIDNAKFS
jgi:hypothetical protein